MACTEHHCRDCAEVWFDNGTRCVCPQCGSTNVAHYFDEDPYDYFDEDDE